MGLPLAPIEPSTYAQGSDVGIIVRRALSLYSELLEANSPTSKFIQALVLLEFLAYPYAYESFKKVKKVVSRYLAKTGTEYERLLVRFEELTGKKDPATGQEVGYRTRIVHIGDRLDNLLSGPDERRRLFEELDSYIRPIIDHMLSHSHMAFDEYLRVRDRLGPPDMR